MIALMAARADPGNYGELLTLQFSRSQTVLGPSQVDNLINQDTEFSEQRTLLGREGSEIQFGSQVILPIEDSLLYVQPVFVTADVGGIPELKYVVLVYNDQVIFETSFERSLEALFGVPEEPDEPDEPEPPDEGEPGEGEPQPPQDEVDARVRELIAQAGRLYDQAQDALAEGDFEEYGRLIERLGRLLEQAEALAAGDDAAAGDTGGGGGGAGGAGGTGGAGDGSPGDEGRGGAADDGNAPEATS